MGLLPVAAVANPAHTMRRVPPAPVGVPVPAYDPLTAQEARFLMLPLEAARRGARGMIGYFGDSGEADDDHYFAQSALASWPLDPNPAPHRWAVANWRTARADRPVPAGWQVEDDGGAGLLLLRREAP